MTIFSWLLVLANLCGMYPYARWLLNEDKTHKASASSILLLALLTLALSTGAFSQIILWIGLLGIPIKWQLITIIYGVLCLIGFFLPTDKSFNKPDNGTSQIAEPKSLVSLFVVSLIGAICAAVIFNAIYWPIGPNDALIIYAHQGKSIAASEHLLNIDSYEAYPMLVQFHYAYIFQMSGWINEYLARLIPALLSIGVIGTAYLLARELVNHIVGLMAALLISISPIIMYWASTGYVDLPCGFFYGMSLLFCVRLGRTQHWRDALLAGVMAGLASWTKNSGLLIIGSFILWTLYQKGILRQTQLSWRHIAIICTAFITIAGIWYTRNLLLAHVVIPPTGWTWKAERTLSNFFPFLMDSQYGIPGPFYSFGMIYIAIRWLRERAQNKAFTTLILFTFPFFCVWWMLFSYDSRFLLVLIVPISVMTAIFCHTLWQRIPSKLLTKYSAYAYILIVLCAIPALRKSLDFKPELLRNPFMSDTEKHELTIGRDRYLMAQYISTLPIGSKIMTQDIYLQFHTGPATVISSFYPTSEAQLTGFSYWVLSGDAQAPHWNNLGRLIHKQGSYRLYVIGG
jgi:hypothetical protein